MISQTRQGEMCRRVLSKGTSIHTELRCITHPPPAYVDMFPNLEAPRILYSGASYGNFIALA